MNTDVTVRVPLEETRDLLRGSARACLGFTAGDSPWIEPVALRYQECRYQVGLEKGSKAPEPGSEVILVIDEGRLFFELRAVYVRGHADSVLDESEDHRTWLEVRPTKITSWDYGRMRVERDDD
jgi:hypothetical protein